MIAVIVIGIIIILAILLIILKTYNRWDDIPRTQGDSCIPNVSSCKAPLYSLRGRLESCFSFSAFFFYHIPFERYHNTIFYIRFLFTLCQWFPGILTWDFFPIKWHNLTYGSHLYSYISDLQPAATTTLEHSLLRLFNFNKNIPAPERDSWPFDDPDKNGMPLIG